MAQKGEVNGLCRARGPSQGRAARPWLAPRARLDFWSAPVAEAVAQEIVEVRNVVDLADGRVDVVLDPLEAHHVVVEHDVAGPPIAVARLTDRADVDQRFARVELVDVVDLLGRVELVKVLGLALREDPRDMRVPLEAVALDQRADAVSLEVVADVLGGT